MMNLKRQYFDVKDIKFSEKKSVFENGVLHINKDELRNVTKEYMKSVKNIDFEIVKPGENTRIIHLLDTIQPMVKIEGGNAYPGFGTNPETVGNGITNLLRGFAVMESAPLPWDDGSASSGLLYPRDAIMDMEGPIQKFTPFYKTNNLVILYELNEGNSSAEYDNDIRLIGLRIATYLAKLTINKKPDEVEEFTTDIKNENLPNVVLVWQCQNQGSYSNTLLYGDSIDNMVPTLLHPNEMLDGAVVSGNYVWPAFKVPSYLHVNHPILLELYRNHDKTINFKGVIFCRSHNPTNWHKTRQANFNVKLAEYLDADGLVMAWEGGGNAAVDGMLTIQCAEQRGIKASTITFEFGGEDGTEGILLVDDVPEADAVISGGSIEKPYTLPDVDRVVGGETMRLNKESGGFFPESNKSISFDTTTHFYLSGNQSGHSPLFAEEY